MTSSDVSGNGKGRARRARPKPRPAKPAPEPKPEPAPRPQPPEMVDWAKVVRESAQAFHVAGQSFIQFKGELSDHVHVRSEASQRFAQGMDLPPETLPGPRKVAPMNPTRQHHKCMSSWCRVDEFWSWPGITNPVCPSCSMASTTKA